MKLNYTPNLSEKEILEVILSLNPARFNYEKKRIFRPTDKVFTM